MRILFIGEGRLGNQVFQYAALSSVASADARILATGLEDLDELFELRGPPLRALRGGIWFKRFAKYVAAPLLRVLARDLRLFSYACEPQRGDAHRGWGGELVIRRGLARGLLFVDGGFYQSSEFWGQLFPPRSMQLRERWRVRARAVLAASAGRPPERPCFIHVRRGDYLGFSSYGVSDLALPAPYFSRAMEELERRAAPDLFVVVTDDPAWARTEFGHRTDMIVLSQDPRTDFAVMAECASGAVSNSTFSLAAALFMRDPQAVIAPRYWFGFRVAQWLPPRIRFEDPRIAYLDVLPGGAT